MTRKDISLIPWEQLDYVEKAEKVLSNIPLTDSQKAQALKTWGENVYQNSPEERRRALGDLQTIAVNLVLSEQDKAEMQAQSDAEIQRITEKN